MRHLLEHGADPNAVGWCAKPPGSPLQTGWNVLRTFTETNPAATLQYFDLRIANSCEDESEDDEPPGLDPPANGCP